MIRTNHIIYHDDDHDDDGGNDDDVYSYQSLIADLYSYQFFTLW